MKKFIFIIFFIILLIPSKNKNIQTVFYEEVESFFELDINMCGITSINIANKLDGINIKKIYPYIDVSYKNILKYDLDYYDIDDINNLDEFIEYYKSLLRNIGKNNLVNTINYKGVPIEKVIVKENFNTIDRIINQNKCIHLIKEV